MFKGGDTVIKIYAADISKRDYTKNAEEFLSFERLEKYRSIGHAERKNQCAAAGFLLNLALGGKQEHYDKNGKPYFEGGFLSISHSGEWVLVAVSETEIGVDIEKIRPADTERLNRKYFADSPENFFENWVKKESMFKKLGTGLKGTGEIEEHSFLILPDFPGYAAALCTEESEYELIIV